jgi:hypothetical protein
VLPRNVCAPALDRMNVNAGVVVGLASEVVNIGESVPAENDVTVPPPKADAQGTYAPPFCDNSQTPAFD